MKILFDHPGPFSLAHGGFQIQIEQTKAALEQLGVTVEYLRFWDDKQRGDIIHFFGRPVRSYVDFAHQKGIKVVISDLLTSQGSRGRMALATQAAVIRTAERILPSTFRMRLAWDSYQQADACIALTAWEAHLMQFLFRAKREKVHIVPNGVEEVFFGSTAKSRGKWLVCTATITERKRVLELAEAAVEAQTPLWIIGRPYSDDDAYAIRFQKITAKYSQYVRYEGAITDRAQIAAAYRDARGFVLLSTMESLSLSALEAAASGAPLLLSDLPWARSVFTEHATYCPLNKSISKTAKVLRQFYDGAETAPVSYLPQRWSDVARELKRIYDQLLHLPQK